MPNQKIEFLNFNQSNDLHDLDKLKELKLLPHLKQASFVSTNLNDEGLKHIAECSALANLNLQDTQITNLGISYLPKLKQLKYLRLKECDLIDDDCMQYINQIPLLEELEIQETAITGFGLTKITNSSIRLIVLEIQYANFSMEHLFKFSKSLPLCKILVKGKGIIKNGELT